jgi:Ca2+-binding EF-hand superfamily protein
VLLAQEMCDIVDFDRDGEISFDEFYDLMTGRRNLEAQAAASVAHQSSGQTAKTDGGGTQHLVAGSSRSIRDIKAIFEEMDEDRSGFLDRNEVRNVSNRVYARPRR